ncbi:hypothetical protein DXG01_015591 [Tephrocybe rancida]|nr:hypothetical protein DXG01_015591 [Tephrocybe rancida]
MRFFLGIGVGAEYPCGSVAASEQSEGPAISKNARHRWVGLATISTLVFGFAIASFTPWVLYLIFGRNHLRAVWRLSLGLGVVPALAVLLWRLNMDEPIRYKTDSMRDTRIPYRLVIRRYWASLAAISVVWFILDIIVSAISNFPTLSREIDMVSFRPQISVLYILIDNPQQHHWRVGGPQNHLWLERRHQVVNLLFVVTFSDNIHPPCSLFYLPGAVIGSFVVDSWGPKWTLIVGLLLQALVGFLMSGLYVPYDHTLFLRSSNAQAKQLSFYRLTNHIAAFSALYGLFFTFAEFGAGLCTFILAAKACPTAVRGQYFGVAAACGKVGAFVGIWMFPPIVKAFGGPDTVRGNTGPFWIASGLCILSALVSLFFVHPLTDEGIEREDREFREYLEAEGYDTSLMGIAHSSTAGSLVEDEKGVSEETKEVLERV